MGLSCLVSKIGPRDRQRTTDAQMDTGKHHISGPQHGPAITII